MKTKTKLKGEKLNNDNFEELKPIFDNSETVNTNDKEIYIKNEFKTSCSPDENPYLIHKVGGLFSIRFIIYLFKRFPEWVFSKNLKICVKKIHHFCIFKIIIIGFLYIMQ
jgi:hypothetical protein